MRIFAALALTALAATPALAQQALPISTNGGCGTSGAIGGRDFYALKYEDGSVVFGIGGIPTNDAGGTTQDSPASNTVTFLPIGGQGPTLTGTISKKAPGDPTSSLAIRQNLTDAEARSMLTSTGRYLAVWIRRERAGGVTADVEKTSEVSISQFFPTLRALLACKPGPEVLPPNQKAELRGSLARLFNSSQATAEYRKLRSLGVQRSAPMTVTMLVAADGQKSCRVTKSSGRTEVDRAFCKILETMSVNVATDAKGKPVSGSFTLDIPVVNFPEE